MACTGEANVISFFKKHKRYLMVYLAFVEFFVSCGTLYNYGILFVSFQEEFHSSAALTGWVGSLANALSSCGGAISVHLVRRFGPRAVMLLGAVLFSIGVVTTSFIPSLVYSYFTFGLLVGLGANFIFQSGMTVVMDTFPGKSCSRGSSLALMGTSFSVLAFAPLFNTLIPAYGWRNSLRIISGGSLVINVLHAVFIVTPTQSQIPRAKSDDSSSYEMIQTNVEKSDASQLQQVDVSKTTRRDIASLLRQVDAWLWVASAVLYNLGWTFTLVNFASFMEYDLSFTIDQVSITFALLGVGEILGKFLLSIFSVHFPFRKLYVLAAGSLLGGVVSGLMTVLRTVPLMYTLTLFTGLFRAASYSMPCPASMELFGDYGSNIAAMIAMVPSGIGVLIGAPISGVLFDLTGNYTLSLLVILMVFICSTGLMLFIPIRRWIASRRKSKHRRKGLKETTV